MYQYLKDTKQNEFVEVIIKNILPKFLENQGSELTNAQIATTLGASEISSESIFETIEQLLV